jgi:two-component system chemotaxis response regulator CheY
MKRILVVDDAATVRLYHRAILEPAGYAVEEAVNGVEALEKVHGTEYQLLLVDVNMPKLDGYRFLAELRSRPELPQPPAVMISTEAELRDRAQAYRAGANFYLVKPTRPEALLAHVRVLLGEPAGSA